MLRQLCLSEHLFRFGYRKAANAKMVPDRVGSGLLLAGTITEEGFHRFLTIDISVRTLMKWRPLCETGIEIRSGRTPGGLRGARENKARQSCRRFDSLIKRAVLDDLLRETN